MFTKDSAEMTIGELVELARVRLDNIKSDLNKLDPVTLSYVLTQLEEAENLIVSALYSHLLSIENESDQTRIAMEIPI